jgi:hypothetical protein
MTEEVRIIRRGDAEIVFASKDDLRKFWDEISNGKVIMLVYNDGSVERSELLNPNNAPQINDGKVKLSSEQKLNR